MDDNQCRVCLGEALDSRLSVFKRVYGVAMEEKLQFVCGLKITKQDNFSKLLCSKCFNETGIAYALKTKCLDTDRTLKNLERKFQTKLKEKVQEIILQNDVKQEYFDVEDDEPERDIKQESLVLFEDSSDEPREEHEEFMEIFEAEAEEECFPAPASEFYEEIEYLETDALQEQAKVEPQSFENPALAKTVKLLCIYCNPNLFFTTEIGLSKHKFEVHQIGEVNPLICQTCNYTFDGITNKEECLARLMRKHLAAHESGKMNSCMLCPEVFKNTRHLEDHEYRNHLNPSSQNKCKGCQSEFSTYQFLQAHLLDSNCKEIHERPFKCFICNETFVMGINKKKHIQSEHQDKAGADCPLCLRCKIPSAVAFENHYKTHFAEPRFCCSYCGRPFYESDRLSTHIRRAHENTKLICNWCDKSFRDKSGIARHILGVHFNQRNHRCHICSKAFTASYNLKEHMFSVHKQASKFYTCETCNQDFLYRKQFERHRNNCSGMPDKRRR